MDEDQFLTIAAVERETRLSKDTLRIWQRRYGFPQPLRSDLGERLYPPEQVQQLQLVQHLLSSGMRPAAVVGLPLAELQALMDQRQSSSTELDAAMQSLFDQCLELLRRHDMPALLQLMNKTAMRLGIASLVCDVLAGLTVEIGRAWARGDINVFEEHLYTDCITTLLRQILADLTLQGQRGAPRVLLTTVPQEGHGLGLLMAHTMLALEGCDCRSLGLQTPIKEVALAVAAQDIDVLALSFSTAMRSIHVTSSLREMRQALPDKVQIWAGGANPALEKTSMAGVLTLHPLEKIPQAVAAWRAAIKD